MVKEKIVVITKLMFFPMVCVYSGKSIRLRANRPEFWPVMSQAGYVIPLKFVFLSGPKGCV